MPWATIRNIVIIMVIAALIVVLPGGGTGANVVIQAVSLAFLATIAWFAALQYRQHRTTLYGLGDGRRAILYVAVGVAALTLTATSRMWHSPAGSIAWLVLMAGAAYAVFAIFWAARRY